MAKDRFRMGPHRHPGHLRTGVPGDYEAPGTQDAVSSRYPWRRVPFSVRPAAMDIAHRDRGKRQGIEINRIGQQHRASFEDDSAIGSSPEPAATGRGDHLASFPRLVGKT